MRPISYARATHIVDAIATVLADPASAYLAGGTTEIDLLRLGVVQPAALVDINALPLDQVEDLADGGLRICALARMSDVAAAPGVHESHAAARRAAEGQGRRHLSGPHAFDVFKGVRQLPLRIPGTRR